MKLCRIQSHLVLIAIILGTPSDALSQRWMARQSLQDTLPCSRTAPSDTLPQRWMVRVSFQQALRFTFAEDTRIENYQASVGYVSPSPLIPSFALYVTYDNYRFDHNWIHTSIEHISAWGIFPAVKLLRIILVGYGYSSGTRMQMERYQGDTTAYYNGTYAHWGSFFACDMDLYVYDEFYLTLGGYFKRPNSYVSVGLSKRF